MSEHVRIPIEGMTCQSCVARITRAVRTVRGVETVRVDLRREQATVGFDPSRTSVTAVVAAIIGAGYEASTAGAVTFTPNPRRGILARLGLAFHRTEGDGLSSRAGQSPVDQRESRS